MNERFMLRSFQVNHVGSVLILVKDDGSQSLTLINKCVHLKRKCICDAKHGLYNKLHLESFAIHSDIQAIDERSDCFEA